jgi:3-oxoacyl-[acyl-carrier protein] reductase
MNSPKTVIVTGASRGIGRKTAELFAHNGYNVLINYNHSQTEAEELQKQLRQAGGQAEIFRANVGRYEEARQMVDFCLAKFGAVDILINNAAISQAKLFTDITPVEWQEMMQVILNGVFNCTQNAVREMIHQKQGKIINISSIWGITGASCEVHYSTAKAGIIGFTKALAKELGPSNIQVNCVAPGVIQTDMLSGYTEDDLEELRQETLVKRLGTPEDVAQLVLFLASEKANYITGQVISPNGGFLV